MPVNPCSENGKPGFKWGDSGKCYLYTSNDESSKKSARRKAIAQGLAIGDIGKGVQMNKIIDKMIKDHNQMKDWHEKMAKSAASMLEDHIKAAAWHSSQADLVKGMSEVPLDPEKKVTAIPTAGGAMAPTSGSGMSAPSKEVPLDPEVRKADLIALLVSHEEEFGKFDIDVESIASFLMND